jgi:hypothetical protein
MRAWFERFIKSTVAFAYHKSNLDLVLFLEKKKRQGKITALFIYIDDMVVMENDYE